MTSLLEFSVHCNQLQCKSPLPNSSNKSWCCLGFYDFNCHQTGNSPDNQTPLSWLMMPICIYQESLLWTQCTWLFWSLVRKSQNWLPLLLGAMLLMQLSAKARSHFSFANVNAFITTDITARRSTLLLFQPLSPPLLLFQPLPLPLFFNNTAPILPKSGNSSNL